LAWTNTGHLQGLGTFQAPSHQTSARVAPITGVSHTQGARRPPASRHPAPPSIIPRAIQPFQYPSTPLGSNPKRHRLTRRRSTCVRRCLGQTEPEVRVCPPLQTGVNERLTKAWQKRRPGQAIKNNKRPRPSTLCSGGRRNTLVAPFFSFINQGQ
jgi:hypothetical protein